MSIRVAVEYNNPSNHKRSGDLVQLHDEDLNWEELEYASVPLRRAGTATVRIEQRGELNPMAYDLDDG